MATSSDDKPPAFQDFESENGKRRSTIPVHVCPETEQVYILWQDVQDTFFGVDYVTLKHSLMRIQFTIGQDGEVSLPLRIGYFEGHAYQVVYRDREGPQMPALEFEQLYRTWISVLEDLEDERTSSRDEFLGLIGNVRYHYSQVSDYLTLLQELGIKAKADGKTEDQIRSEFKEYQYKMKLWDHENTCVHILRRHASFPAPCRFVVLPADLGSWDDSDPVTHNFRLYFLCDINKGESTVPDLPDHKHIANHPGYILVRPQEFFQTYGSYTLTMLKMVKNGFSERSHEIPSLDTLNILWCVDVDDSGNRLTKNTIRPLVDKAIDYLDGLSLPLRGSEKWLTERESVAIRDFLVVPDGGNVLGGLYRYTTKYDTWTWVCKQHAHEWIAPGTLEALVDFVHGCGGQVDLQEATISIELQSRQQADQFCTLLNGTEQRFHVSITLRWRDVSRHGLDTILQEIATAKVQHLDLDGVPHGIHPHGVIDSKTDLFASLIQRNKELRSVTLLNYPRPQEQFTYIDVWGKSVLSLHSKLQQPVKTKHWWMDLRNNVNNLLAAILSHKRSSVLQRSQNLQNLLARDGYELVSSVSLYEAGWQGVFDLGECILQQLHLDLLALDESPKVWETTVVFQALEFLRTLTLDVTDFITDHEVARIVQKCPQLRELNITIKHAHVLDNVLDHIQRIFEMWQGRQDPLQLALLERGEFGQGRIVSRVIVSGRARCHSGSSIPDQEWKQGVAGEVEFSQWEIDHVAASLTDRTAALLDKATAQNPSVMVSLFLDVSHLSKDGLAHVQNILQRSTLGHLHIRCIPFDPVLTDFIRRILLSVQWSTLQSLVLTDIAVNEWIQQMDGVWKEASAPNSFVFNLQLQCLGIQGSDKSPVNLSHSNMLVVHQLLYSNLQMELALQHVYSEQECGCVVELL